MAIDNSGSPSKYGSNSEESAAAARRRAGLTASSKSAAKKTTSKTITTPGTKVSQATIDKIKAMGMKKALAGAANASPEMREGLKRMYGAKRVGAAAPSSTTYKSADAARAAASKPAKPVYKSADAARAAATRPAKPVAKTADGARMDALRKSGGQNMPYKASTPATKKNVGSRIADTVTGKNKPKTAAYNAEQAKLLADWKAAKAKKNK